MKIKRFLCVLLWQKDFAFQNRNVCSGSDAQNGCVRIGSPLSAANASRGSCEVQAYCMTERDAFVSGFKLGARIIIEVMNTELE